jgi:serine/threonine protein kinase/tetratricopeptide (TPR) repeat protein
MRREYQIGDEPVSGYRLKKCLGRGGLGQVWQATGPGGVEVALKAMEVRSTWPPEKLSLLRALKQIRHPNLLPVLDVWLVDADGHVVVGENVDDLTGSGNEQVWVATGLAEKSLRDVLLECQQQGLPGIPRDQLLDYLEDAARAVDFLNAPLHDLGDDHPRALPHGDVKPDNLMLVGDTVQVCSIGQNQCFVDDSGPFCATIAYTAPEVLRQNSPMPSSDQYSLAISYYELRTGKLPFAGTMSLPEILATHLAGKLDLHGLDEGERAVIERATDPSPADRFETCSELVDALRRESKPDILRDTFPALDHRPPTRLRIEVYREGRLIHADEIDRSIELGRQLDPREPLFTPLPGEGAHRLVVAPIEENTISRRQLLVEPLTFDRMRITNLAKVGRIQVDGMPIDPGSTQELPLPCQMVVGSNYWIRFSSVSPNPSGAQPNLFDSVLGCEQVEAAVSYLRDTGCGIAPPAEQGPAASQDPSLQKIHANVQFTVYRPKTMRPRQWYTLLAFAHLDEKPSDAPADEPDPIKEVERQARQVLGPQLADSRQTTQDSLQAVPHAGALTFVPEIDGVIFNPRQQTLYFVESVHKAEFRMSTGLEHDGQVLRGGLSVFLGPILLAAVPLTIAVDSNSQHAESSEPVRVPRYRKIFASYSHRDSQIVETFEQLAEALGDRYLRDCKHLRSGEEWGPRLMEMIEEADVFQLFWSSNSMRSHYCRQEWEYALSLRRDSFVRPTYWEDPFPEEPAEELPPAPLKALHFTRFGREPRASGTEAGRVSHAPAVRPSAPAPLESSACAPDESFANRGVWEDEDPPTVRRAAPRRRSSRPRWVGAAGLLLLVGVCGITMEMRRREAAVPLVTSDDSQIRDPVVFDRAALLDELGEQSLKSGDPPQALKLFQEALDIKQALAAARPEDDNVQFSLALSHIKLGRSECQQFDYAAAGADFTMAANMLRQPKLSRLKGETELALAVAVDGEQYCARAVTAVDGIEEFEQRLSVASVSSLIDFASLSREYDQLLYIRCRELARRGDFEGAVDAADKLHELAGDDFEQLYKSACTYGLCVRVLDTPPRGGAFLPPEEPRELSPDEQAARQKYLKLALGTLEQAISAGYNDADNIHNDDDLTPLRELPEFQKLLDSISPKTEAQPD